MAVVLVHGAFVDGSGWRPVHDLLTQDGYQVAVVQNPTVSLRDDVAATRLVIDAQDGPVVLVGHSYGGAVITEAGTHPKVGALVYVAAFAPDADESVNTLIDTFPSGAPQMPGLPPRGGFIHQDPKKFHESFGADLPDDLAAFMSDAEVPWGTDAATGTVTDPAWRTRPSWYLVATQDRELPPATQRTMARRARSTVVELPATHAVYITRPAPVADLIERAARGDGPRQAGVRPVRRPASVKPEADDMVDEEPRAELARLEAQIAELRQTARELRDGLNDAGPTDIEDRSQVIYEAEQQEAIVGELERRRDELRAQLG
ncbi:alpha/beta hydrolase [Nocardioides sp. HB32]